MQPDSTITRRAVLLGASNISRGLGAAVAAACRIRPHRIYIAAGRGRAYSQASSLLIRGLPSILDCPLWEALANETGKEDSDPGELYALVTDLGNDLAYGAEVDTIFDAVAGVLELLRAADAHLVLAPLPLASLDRFPTLWLDTVRRALFPGSTLSASILIERAHRLDEQVRRLCHELDVSTVDQPAEWYGLDPIHHKTRAQVTAFNAMTQPWLARAFALSAGGATTPREDIERRPSLAMKCRLATAWPLESELLGRSITRHQPSARIRGGPDILLY